MTPSKAKRERDKAGDYLKSICNYPLLTSIKQISSWLRCAGLEYHTDDICVLADDVTQLLASGLVPKQSKISAFVNYPGSPSGRIEGKVTVENLCWVHEADASLYRNPVQRLTALDQPNPLGVWFQDGLWFANHVEYNSDRMILLGKYQTALEAHLAWIAYQEGTSKYRADWRAHEGLINERTYSMMTSYRAPRDKRLILS